MALIMVGAALLGAVMSSPAAVSWASSNRRWSPADIATGDLSLYPVDDARYEVALQLIGSYPDHPLGTLDALHLGVAQHVGTACLATADAVMADAARALGFDVKRFGARSWVSPHQSNARPVGTRHDRQHTC